MAVIKFTGLVSEMKGKLSGSVLQGGKSAQVIRSNTIQKLSRTNLQIQSKARFTSISNYWRSIGSVNQDSWKSLAASWIFYDKFGTPYQGSNFQIFQSCNLSRLTIGRDFLNYAPSFNIISDVGPCTIDYVDSTEINLNTNIPFGVANHFMYLYAANQVSTGINYPPTNYRFIVDISSHSRLPFNLAPFYSDIFGTINPNRKIFFKLLQLDIRSPYLQFEQNISIVTS